MTLEGAFQAEAGRKRGPFGDAPHPMIPLLDLAAMLVGDRQPNPAWSDRRLIRACLKGKEAAWQALVDKYKNLVFALAVESGASADEAAELFQAVWIQVHRELPALAKKPSIRAWLISVATRECQRWQQRAARDRRRRGNSAAAADRVMTPESPPVDRLEREHLVREALRRLSPRCREVVRKLFFDRPPKPDRDLAAELGISFASFLALRDRCLARLQRLLQSLGAT